MSMKTEKFFYNEETETLILLTLEDEESDIERFQFVCSFEYDDTEEEEPEQASIEIPKKKGRPKSEKHAGGRFMETSATG